MYSLGECGCVLKARVMSVGGIMVGVGEVRMCVCSRVRMGKLSGWGCGCWLGKGNCVSLVRVMGVFVKHQCYSDMGVLTCAGNERGAGGVFFGCVNVGVL